MSKLSAKIAQQRKNLEIVSQERLEIEKLAALTDNDAIKTFILTRAPRMDEDMKSLRKSIVYQVQKYAENMNVTQFQKLAEDLETLVS